MNFDKHAAALLNACGYVCTHHPESWEDVGSAESGPRLSGGPAFDEWGPRQSHHHRVRGRGRRRLRGAAVGPRAGG